MNRLKFKFDGYKFYITFKYNEMWYLSHFRKDCGIDRYWGRSHVFRMRIEKRFGETANA